MPKQTLAEIQNKQIKKEIKKSGDRLTVVVLGCVPVNPTEIVEIKKRKFREGGLGQWTMD